MASYPPIFLAAVEFALREEVGPFASTGGYLSPERAARIGDPGGETKWGISRHSYPDLDIATLTREQAIELYFRDYWQTRGAKPLPASNQRSYCDDLPGLLAFVHFDCAVNVGNRKVAADGTPVWHGNANKILQSALGVEEDGYIGPVTRAAAHRGRAEDLALKAIAARERFYRSRGAWADGFRKSWLKRTARLTAALTKRETLIA